MAPKSLDLRNFATVASLTVLVGTEVFGSALVAGWAIAGLLELGPEIRYALMAIFSALGLWAMIGFVRTAVSVEPFRR